MNFPTPKWSTEKIIKFTREALADHVRQAWHIGRALLILRKKVKHGKWMDYCKATFPEVHHSTLWRYMQVAQANENADDVTSLVVQTKNPRKVVENPGEVQQNADDTPPPVTEWQDKIDSLDELTALCGAAEAALDRLSRNDVEVVRKAWGKYPVAAVDILIALREKIDACVAWANEKEEIAA